MLIVPALAVLLGLQPVTTDLYLPALPALQADLRSSMAATQLTLSALLLSFGLSQLFAGPLADRYGRKPVLLAGLVLYALATVASGLAPGIETLVICRALQGLGMAACIVCARAMVRDLFEPQDGAKVMARSLTGLGLIALTGPVAGALLVGLWGWRATFAACGVYVALTLAGVVWLLPETLKQPNHDATRLRPLLKTVVHMMGHRSFTAWALLIAFTYGTIYSYLAGSAFVFIEVYGTSRLHYGAVVSATTLFYILGTLACHRSLPRRGIQRTVQRGARFTLLGAGMLIGLALSGWPSPTLAMIGIMILTFGHGHHQPCAQAAVIGPFPAQAGTASALAGFLMSVLAFGISLWLGVAVNGTAAPLLLTIAAFALLTAGVAMTLVQRHGDPDAHGRDTTPRPVAG